MKDHQGLLNGSAGKVFDGGELLFMRRPEFAVSDSLEYLAGLDTADPYDTDSSAPSGRGFCIYGICYDRDTLLGAMSTFLYTPSPTLLVFTWESFFKARWIIRLSYGFIFSRNTDCPVRLTF